MLASCQNTEVTPAVTTEQTAFDTTPQTEEVLNDGLPEVNMDGFTLRTLHHNNDFMTWTVFCIDLCIIRTDRSGWYRLIHQKTGFSYNDQYFWNQAKNSAKLKEKIDWLKENDCWQEVINTYLEKKNMYLCRRNNDHSSFNIYIETVNEIFNKY